MWGGEHPPPHCAAAVGIGINTRVADPHHFDEDWNPDPIHHFDADTDPTFHFDAGMDPIFQIMAQKLEKGLKFHKFWLFI